MVTIHPPREERACGGEDAASDEGDLRGLLAQISSGDQDAMQRLYVVFYQRMWSYLWRQLDRDPGWTEEAVQDVFLAAWRSAASYRGEARVGTWLFRIAHNLAANARRAKGRRLQGQPLDSVGSSDEQGEVGDALALHSAEDVVVGRMMLAQALGRLSPHHRDVLDLAFHQGFGADEIAMILAIPVGTVKSRMSYARRALQQQLTQAQAIEEAQHARDV